MGATPGSHLLITRHCRLRIAALTQLFKRYHYEPLSADVRARAIYVMQMGYISMRSEEALSVRMMRVGQYVEVFTGHRPEERALGRLFARHRYQEAGSIGLTSGMQKKDR